MRSSNLALIVAILALLIGGALYYYDQKTRPIDTLERENADLGSDSLASGNETFAPAPTKIDLTPLGGIEANAVSNRVFANDKFILTVNAELPTLANGTFYQVFITKENNSGESAGDAVISLGKLEEDGGSYYLEYKNDKDLSAYGKISISIEKIFDSTPEEKVMEGTF